MVWWFGKTPHIILPPQTPNLGSICSMAQTELLPPDLSRDIDQLKKLSVSVWLPRLAETICDSQQRLCPLPLSVAEDVLILICFIDDPRGRGTKIDGSLVFWAWHEYLREEKQTAYNAPAHFIYIQHTHFMHSQLAYIILFKVP